MTRKKSTSKTNSSGPRGGHSKRRESVKVVSSALDNSFRKGAYWRASYGDVTRYYKKSAHTKSQITSYFEKKYIIQDDVILTHRKKRADNIIVYKRDYKPSKENPGGVTRIAADRINKKTKFKFTLVGDVSYVIRDDLNNIFKTGTVRSSSSTVGNFNDKLAELKHNAKGLVRGYELVEYDSISIMGEPQNLHYSFIVPKEETRKVLKDIVR